MRFSFLNSSVQINDCEANHAQINLKIPLNEVELISKEETQVVLAVFFFKGIEKVTILGAEATLKFTCCNEWVPLCFAQ